MYKSNINWYQVEAAIYRSVRGQASQEGRDLCALAYQADPIEYVNLQKRVKKEAQSEINPLAKKNRD